MFIVFFQAEDGIRDLVRSRGLGDVYKRQQQMFFHWKRLAETIRARAVGARKADYVGVYVVGLSLIHI